MNILPVGGSNAPLLFVEEGATDAVSDAVVSASERMEKLGVSTLLGSIAFLEQELTQRAPAAFERKGKPPGWQGLPAQDEDEISSCLATVTLLNLALESGKTELLARPLPPRGVRREVGTGTGFCTGAPPCAGGSSSLRFVFSLPPTLSYFGPGGPAGPCFDAEACLQLRRLTSVTSEALRTAFARIKTKTATATTTKTTTKTTAKTTAKTGFLAALGGSRDSQMDGAEAEAEAEAEPELRAGYPHRTILEFLGWCTRQGLNGRWHLRPQPVSGGSRHATRLRDEAGIEPAAVFAFSRGERDGRGPAADETPKWRALKEAHGTALAYHGTDAAALWSILNSGLRCFASADKMAEPGDKAGGGSRLKGANLPSIRQRRGVSSTMSRRFTAHGQMLGDGVYLGALAVAATFAKSRVFTGCEGVLQGLRDGVAYAPVLECEVVDSAANLPTTSTKATERAEARYYVVSDPSQIRIRRLLLYERASSHCPSGPSEGGGPPAQWLQHSQAVLWLAAVAAVLAALWILK